MKASYARAIVAELKPVKITDTMAFMFESRWVIRPTDYAMNAPTMQLDYDDVWTDFEKARPTLAKS